MERLARDPQNFREIVEADLRRAGRLIVKIQDEIDPQIRVATPEGDYHIALTLPPDDYGRRSALRALALFLAWKQALAFTFASEIYTPDAVYCVGIGPRERFACIARIERNPKPWTAKNFSPAEWLPDASIDPAMIELLPTGAREMTAKDLATLEKWFGANGKFPAIKIVSGELGL
jgi:hypothetical protein